MMEQKEVRSADDDLASIMDLLATSVERHRIETINKVRDALHNVQAVFEEVQAELGGALTLAQTGFALDGEIGRNTLLWNRVGTGETLLSTTYEIIPTGDELILRMSGEPIYRGSQTAPEYGEAFRTVVRSWVLARINSVLSNPDALPPEADLFLEVRPHSTLQTAAEDALRTGKHILAFVYDPAQSKRGRLRYGLMYFLQNRRTRDVINAAFITALVPLAQLASISNILDHTSMEESRWVVLDSNLKPLEHAVIYANAQEGERIVSDLAKRYRGG
jgi:serine/threonine-protein kinase